MENHHVSWKNPLEMAIFDSYGMLWPCLPEGMAIMNLAHEIVADFFRDKNQAPPISSGAFKGPPRGAGIIAFREEQRGKDMYRPGRILPGWWWFGTSKS